MNKREVKNIENLQFLFLFPKVFHKMEKGVDEMKNNKKYFCATYSVGES